MVSVISPITSAVQVQDLPQVGRRLRRPSHPFNVKFNPWQIQPFMIAPVLPGDTMKNLLMQAKVVSDPLKHPHVGWWFETYFFYVKLRDLSDRDALVQMLMTSTGAPAAGAANPRHYYRGQGIDYVGKCLDRIVDTYFRDEEEVNSTDGVRMMNGLPQAKIAISDWTENLKIGSDAPISDGTPIPGDHWPELPEHLAAFAPAYEQWQQMQHLHMAAPTFEDYVKTFGVKLPKADREELHRPELIRYIRDWKMPSNTVDPVTGAPSSAVVWDIAERADKDRFFAEPGFVFGVMTARPKVYQGAQASTLTAFMNDGYTWLPALLAADPFTSLRKFTAAVSPINALPEDHWVDMADLLLNGEQFLSHPVAELKVPIVATPVAQNWDEAEATGDQIALNKTYAADDDMTYIFKDTTFPPTTAAKQFFHVDGRVDLTVLSRLQDNTR